MQRATIPGESSRRSSPKAQAKIEDDGDDLPRFLAEGPVRFVAGLRHAVRGYHVMHDHPSLEIVFHPRGAGRTKVASGDCFDFDEGSVVIYGPRQAHDQATAVPGDDYCIHIDLGPRPPAALRGSQHLSTSDDPFLVNELHLLSRARADDAGLAQTALDLRARALLAHLMLSRAAVAATAERAPDRLADQAKRHIREHCHEIASLEDVARHLGVGDDHLRHAFKARHGLSPVRWLAEMRVEKAKDLLTHTGLPLKAIARGCGFETEQYFCAVFRKISGRTPGAHRKGNGRTVGGR